MAETTYAGTDTFDEIKVSESGDGTATFWDNSFKKAVNCIRWLFNRTPTIVAVLQTDGAGGVVVESSRGTFTPTIAGNYIRITFGTAMSSVDYCVQVTVVATLIGSPMRSAAYLPLSTLGGDIVVADNTGTVLNAGTTAIKLSMSITDLP
jgi:hypothetical protein